MHVSVGKKNKRIYRPLVNDEILQIKLRDFCDSPELETPGSYPITVECDLAGRRLEYAIGHLQVNCACKLCGNESRNTAEALDHIAKAHRSELFGPITEARRTELLSQLPAAIYHCRYCEMDLIFKYIDDTAYGADKHLKDACHGAPQTERDLPILVKSRAALEEELTETQACCVCKEEFYGSDFSAMAAHYAHHHKEKALRLIH